MAIKLKPVNEQVIVITGATSGIGLATAKRAARHGAKLALAARNAEQLQKIVNEIVEQGGEAISYALDVANRGEVEKLAEAALQKFGRIDTWINDAGIGIWGKLEDVKEEDSRRMFDTNFWGLVNGSLVASRHLRENGGAIINLGSVAADITLALQSMYSATKHAIKGFTDGLRQELEMDNAPISVTLIKPSAIGTPFAEKAKNYLSREPQLPPPIYDAEEVAIAILYAASHQTRDVYVGAGGKVLSTLNKLAPRVMDLLAENFLIKAELKDEPAKPRWDNLFRSASEGKTAAKSGTLPQTPMRSAYTRAITHPTATVGVITAVIGVGAAVAFALAEQRAQRGIEREIARKGMRLGKRVKHWADDEASPRLRKYGRKYGEYASRLKKTRRFWD